MLYALGAFVMRSAGCIINDLADVQFDRLVERTKSRPLASSLVTPFQAFLLLGFLLSLGLLILLQLPTKVILLGAASLILVILYPFMKRITYWPQLFLGFTFNYGALLGYLTLHESLSLSAYCLYAAGIFWTLGYDTIYAHQDKKDDLLIGVKSTALLFKEKTIYYLVIFYTMTIFLILIAGFLEGKNYLFYILLNVASIHFIWQLSTFDIENIDNCNKKFTSNVQFGLIIFFAFYLG